MRFVIIALSVLGLLYQAGTGLHVTPNALHVLNYTGPGDVISNASAWWGLRAYTKAYAVANSKAINVRRASDNTTQDINVATTGDLNIASANTFATVDATCTGTASASTTISFTGCSSTPNAKDTLTSTGGSGSFTQPVYLVSCGSFAGGAGSCTMNTAQTVTGATVKAQVALFVTEIYDQTGNGIHQTQATAANQAQLLPTCLNGKPCMLFSGAQGYSNASCPIPAAATQIAPILAEIVQERTGGFSSGTNSFQVCQNNSIGGDPSPNTVKIFLTNFDDFVVTAADNVAHELIQNTSGGSAIPPNVKTTLYLDGVAHQNVNADPPGNNTGPSEIGGQVGGFPYTGYITQAGAWYGDTTADQAARLCLNDANYWFGSSLSCAAPLTFANTTGPCDVVTCAEAYSMTRAMVNSYQGPLFQIWNASSSSGPLDILQNPTTRQADMTTWSAYCSGVASNCLVTRIYGQINRGKNDLATHTCNTSLTGTCPQFAIEGATGLPIFISADVATDGAGAGQFRIQPGDTALTGVPGGTHDETVVMNGQFPSSAFTDECCGQFLLADFNGSPPGADMGWATHYGCCSAPVRNCASAGHFCFILDFEGAQVVPVNDAAGQNISTTQISWVGFVDHTITPSELVTVYYNGHALASAAPSIPLTIKTPPGMHLSCGGDCTTPAPTVFREGFVVNSILSSTQRANILSNETTFYSGVSFP